MSYSFFHENLIEYDGEKFIIKMAILSKNVLYMPYISYLYIILSVFVDLSRYFQSGISGF